MLNAPRPRHVLLITTDHMRDDCIGAHGREAMHTPDLDRHDRGDHDVVQSLVNCHVRSFGTDKHRRGPRSATGGRGGHRSAIARNARRPMSDDRRALPTSPVPAAIAP